MGMGGGAPRADGDWPKVFSDGFALGPALPLFTTRQCPLLLAMDEAAIVAELRRQHSVGSRLFFEDPEFPATDKSLYFVRAGWRKGVVGQARD